jgi:hypothetical protein
MEGVGLNTFGTALKAGGNINPSRFVKISTAANETVLQAGTNEDMFGISQPGVDQPPGVTGSDGLAARAGENLLVYGPGSTALLEIGSGGCNPADYLKSDTDGKGVTAATSGPTAQFVGAIALETGSSGDKIRVYVVKLPKFYPALS